MGGAAKLTAARQPDMSTVACLHLLVKFSGSRNPVSRRTNQSTAKVTTEEAIAEIEKIAEEVRRKPVAGSRGLPAL